MSDRELPLRVPACTSCVRRKTKCDRESPCSSCIAAKAQCHYVQKRAKKRQRVHVSSEYEKNLSCVNHQLEALSNTLQSLVKNNEALNQGWSNNNGSKSTLGTIHTLCEQPCPKDSSALANLHDHTIESSLSPLSSQAKRMEESLSKAVSSEPINTANAQATAVDVVQTLMRDAEAANFPAYEEDPSQSIPCAFSQYSDLAGLSLPGSDSVLRLLAFARKRSQSYFVDFPHTDEDEFATLCQRIYFPTQPFTIFAWINANCGLYYLFRELDDIHYEELLLTSSQVAHAVSICSNNIDRAIKSLELCVNPSYEAVDALICAAAMNMERAKGFLAWKLVSTAARMTIDLGYHHLPLGNGNRQISQKRKLFWYVYAMDKSLAFNFSRSPTIQDCDVSTQRPTSSEDFMSKWGFSFLGYIEFSKLQSDIYKQLFSAQAQQEPLPVRIHRAHEFAAKILQIKNHFTAAQGEKSVVSAETGSGSLQPVDIGFSSVLTLIYRLLPPDDSTNDQGPGEKEFRPLCFHRLCVEAGRAALNALVSGWTAVSKASNEDAAKPFVNLTSLFVPFMPYVAVCGEYIASGSQEDLALLREVVKVVEATTGFSNAAKKLHKAFSRLLGIAELWTSTNHSKERQRTRSPQMLPNGTPRHDLKFSTSNKRSLSYAPTADINMMTPDPTDFSAVEWQDLNMSHQDWNMMFNEFDLGPGAESARDMMPWFEQHMSGFSTFNQPAP